MGGDVRRRVSGGWRQGGATERRLYAGNGMEIAPPSVLRIIVNTENGGDNN
ncbi:MAG: hypothetical protein LBB22_02055 [Treponema sp.]|nr:hypothetical protein [Treponema sp.]